MQVVLSATLSRLYRVLGDIHMSSDTLVEIFCWFSDFYPCSIVVAYAEHFHGGSFSGIWWLFAFGVRCL